MRASWKIRRLMLVLAASATTAGGILLAPASATAQVTIAPEELPQPSAEDRALLKDAIDVHAHLDPDSYGAHSAQAARSLDVVDMAQRAKDAGMTGFVIKQHYDQTAQLAYLASKVVPGVEAFGQMGTNLAMGGLNPEAVHHFAEIKGGRARIVSMPTWDSENNVRHSPNPDRPFVAVSRDGELLPETVAVITAIATAKVRDSDARLALATGHVSAEEALLIVKEARRQGIDQIIVTHAIGHPINMTLEQMREAARMGAFIEFVGAFIVGSHAEFTLPEYLDAIRYVGVDHVILSSDSGQLNRPFPDDMIALVAGQLKAGGMSSDELRKIMVENPRRLLGLN